MAFADTLVIPVGAQGSQALKSLLPRRGQLMADVESRLGPPLAIAPPVGDPPITVWEYPEFRVIFEYDHVVHAVLTHRPEATLPAD
jgi:hypothetical protein